MRIAIIPPIAKSDYLTNTVIDGILWLKREGESVELAVPDYNYPCPYDISSYKKIENDFIHFAQTADLIILCWGKAATNYVLANKINLWSKTVFIDGSELGKDRRSDPVIRKQVEEMTYEGIGAIDKEMLSKCAKYFRREKPYINGIIPLPFGIESRYIAQYDPAIKKEIDFVCIFGQEDFPKMRREVREYIEGFCKENNLKCATKKTKGFSFDDDTKQAGRDQFYEILTQSKVGISVGGGGYDTARFWEILGNNCLLLTEKIDIYEEGSGALNYQRIWQFSDFEDFKKQLGKVKEYLKGYNQSNLTDEYQKILADHSSKSRVRMILSNFFVK